MKCWFNKPNARTNLMPIYSFTLRLYCNYSDTKTKSIFRKLKEKEKVNLVQSREKTRTTLSINSKDFEKLPKLLKE